MYFFPGGTSISVLMINVQGMMLSVSGQDHVQALTLFPVVFLHSAHTGRVFGHRPGSVRKGEGGVLDGAVQDVLISLTEAVCALGNARWRKSLVGFLHLAEEVGGEDEAVEAFVGGGHDLVFRALPFLASFIYI